MCENVPGPPVQKKREPQQSRQYPDQDQEDDMELYIHIPFCIRKCNYCDFLSFPAGEETIETYCRALCEEIRRTGEAVHKRTVGPADGISTIFVGGGTPSVLSPMQIRRLFACLRQNFSIRSDAEISMEANPGTLDGEKLSACREAGVNRLSIGLQSADDGLLRTLGRIHTWEQFQENYKEFGNEVFFSDNFYEESFFYYIIKAIEKAYQSNKTPVLVHTGTIYGMGFSNINVMEHRIVMSAQLPLIAFYPATVDKDNINFLGKQIASKYRCIVIK